LPQNIFYRNIYFSENKASMFITLSIILQPKKVVMLFPDIPRGLCHNLHGHVSVAPFVFSHSICTSQY